MMYENYGPPQTNPYFALPGQRPQAAATGTAAAPAAPRPASAAPPGAPTAPAAPAAAKKSQSRLANGLPAAGAAKRSGVSKKLPVAGPPAKDRPVTSLQYPVNGGPSNQKASKHLPIGAVRSTQHVVFTQNPGSKMAPVQAVPSQIKATSVQAPSQFGGKRGRSQSPGPRIPPRRTRSNMSNMGKKPPMFVGTVRGGAGGSAPGVDGPGRVASPATAVPSQLSVGTAIGPVVSQNSMMPQLSVQTAALPVRSTMTMTPDPQEVTAIPPKRVRRKRRKPKKSKSRMRKPLVIPITPVTNRPGESNFQSIKRFLFKKKKQSRFPMRKNVIRLAWACMIGGVCMIVTCMVTSILSFA